VRRRRRGPVPDRLLCVLLFGDKLERIEERERAEALLRSPGVVAIEPPALGYQATTRMGMALRDRIALGQARRLQLPGHARAIVAFEPAQYPLARALLSEHPEAELWYGGSGTGDLHEAAAARAAFRFSGLDGTPLYERMEALGIESGRLGSERSRPG
jgi:hypothetical protein